MSYYNYGYNKKYESAADRALKQEQSLAKLRKKNPDVKPVVLQGRKITRTWWGNSWVNNLIRYSDYSNRLDRGTAYVRRGAVLDLQITEGTVNAKVQGTRKTPYNVQVEIKPLSKAAWDDIRAKCEGRIESLKELIDGKFPQDLSELFTNMKNGLFPSPSDISFNCSCPDWASMCKHVAAALYGVGARLDEDPAIFFVLRNADINQLISSAVAEKSKTLIEKSDIKSNRTLNEEDISDMFGIDV